MLLVRSELCALAFGDPPEVEWLPRWKRRMWTRWCRATATLLERRPRRVPRLADRARRGRRPPCTTRRLRRSLYEPVADAVGSKIGQQALPPHRRDTRRPGSAAPLDDVYLGLSQLPGFSR
ncbi:hypothetical protein ACRAWF_05130 [Streptomyces sp. L7]